MKILGIYPGLSGAMALVGDGHLAVEDMPFVGSNKNRVVDMLRMADIIKHWSPDHAVIEKVHAMPGQGVSSTFRFGQTLGRTEAVIALAEIPLTYVQPTKWKKFFRLGRDKEDSRRLAIELYPHIADRLHRKKDEGRAEALLIATHHLEKRTKHETSSERDDRQAQLPFAD